MTINEIERLIQLLARLPGLGPRSARRAVLEMIKRPDTLMLPLASAIQAAAVSIRKCSACGNLDTRDPCAICIDGKRDAALICVVEEVSDLWAIERSGAFKGRYHVVGGTLSALDGRGPAQLNIAGLTSRLRGDHAPGDHARGNGAEENGAEAETGLVAEARPVKVTEVILALSTTVDGQTTAHYIADRLAGQGVMVSRLAQGIPVGGELDYLDDGTLSTALRARRPV